MSRLKPLFDPSDRRPIHFVGIAGAGMSALALVARRRGVEVTGCDLNSAETADLVAAGAEVYEGHDPSHVRGIRAIVHTSAVTAEHEELKAARHNGVRVLRRADALAELMGNATVVAVAGTHGKTTTTTMVTEVLAAAGLQPTGITGGRVASWGGNARLDGDNLFVVEADEYDKSFLSLDPTIAIVNNVEADHLECYGSVTALEEAFVEFAGRAERALVGHDDAGTMRVARRLDVPVWTVGTDQDADISILDVVLGRDTTVARVRLPEGEDIRLQLRLPGLHNLRNATMALGVAHALGADIASALDALSTFSGVARRFEIVGSEAGVTVVDDYAHHPSEVVATLAAARQRFPGSRLTAVFQPHLYSRTQQLAVEFGVALAAADRAVVTDVYPAREQPIEGVDGRLVVVAAQEAGADVAWVSDVSALPDHLMAIVGGDEVVVTLGAGNITTVARLLLGRLRGEVAA